MPKLEIERLDEGFHPGPGDGWAAYPFVQGFGADPADIRGVHVVAIMPGQARGNHYHVVSDELLFMFAGTGTFFWEEDGVVREYAYDGGPALIKIPPGVRHAFKNTGETAVFLLAVRDGDFDPAKPDTVRSVIV